MTGVVLGMPLLANTLAKIVKLYAKIHKMNNFAIDMHHWERRKSLPALLATCQIRKNLPDSHPRRPSDLKTCLRA